MLLHREFAVDIEIFLLVSRVTRPNDVDEIIGLGCWISAIIANNKESF
jgi:hypothetical protein